MLSHVIVQEPERGDGIRTLWIHSSDSNLGQSSRSEPSVASAVQTTNLLLSYCLPWPHSGENNKAADFAQVRLTIDLAYENLTSAITRLRDRDWRMPIIDNQNGGIECQRIQKGSVVTAGDCSCQLVDSAIQNVAGATILLATFANKATQPHHWAAALDLDFILSLCARVYQDQTLMSQSAVMPIPGCCIQLSSAHLSSNTYPHIFASQSVGEDLNSVPLHSVIVDAVPIPKGLFPKNATLAFQYFTNCTDADEDMMHIADFTPVLQSSDGVAGNGIVRVCVIASVDSRQCVHVQSCLPGGQLIWHQPMGPIEFKGQGSMDLVQRLGQENKNGISIARCACPTCFPLQSEILAKGVKSLNGANAWIQQATRDHQSFAKLRQSGSASLSWWRCLMDYRQQRLSGTEKLSFDNSLAQNLYPEPKSESETCADCGGLGVCKHVDTLSSLSLLRSDAEGLLAISTSLDSTCRVWAIEPLMVCSLADIIGEILSEGSLFQHAVLPHCTLPVQSAVSQVFAPYDLSSLSGSWRSQFAEGKTKKILNDFISLHDTHPSSCALPKPTAFQIAAIGEPLPILSCAVCPLLPGVHSLGDSIKSVQDMGIILLMSDLTISLRSLESRSLLWHAQVVCSTMPSFISKILKSAFSNPFAQPDTKPFFFRQNILEISESSLSKTSCLHISVVDQCSSANGLEGNQMYLQVAWEDGSFCHPEGCDKVFRSAMPSSMAQYFRLQLPTAFNQMSSVDQWDDDPAGRFEETSMSVESFVEQLSNSCFMNGLATPLLASGRLDALTLMNSWLLQCGGTPLEASVSRALLSNSNQMDLLGSLRLSIRAILCARENRFRANQDLNLQTCVNVSREYKNQECSPKKNGSNVPKTEVSSFFVSKWSEFVLAFPWALNASAIALNDTLTITSHTAYNPTIASSANGKAIVDLKSFERRKESTSDHLFGKFTLQEVCKKYGISSDKLIQKKSISQEDNNNSSIAPLVKPSAVPSLDLHQLQANTVAPQKSTSTSGTYSQRPRNGRTATIIRGSSCTSRPSKSVQSARAKITNFGSQSVKSTKYQRRGREEAIVPFQQHSLIASFEDADKSGSIDDLDLLDSCLSSRMHGSTNGGKLSPRLNIQIDKNVHVEGRSHYVRLTNQYSSIANARTLIDESKPKNVKQLSSFSDRGVVLINQCAVKSQTMRDAHGMGRISSEEDSKLAPSRVPQEYNAHLSTFKDRVHGKTMQYSVPEIHEPELRNSVQHACFKQRARPSFGFKMRSVYQSLTSKSRANHHHSQERLSVVTASIMASRAATQNWIRPSTAQVLTRSHASLDANRRKHKLRGVGTEAGCSKNHDGHVSNTHRARTAKTIKMQFGDYFNTVGSLNAASSSSRSHAIDAFVKSGRNPMHPSEVEKRRPSSVPTMGLPSNHLPNSGNEIQKRMQGMQDAVIGHANSLNSTSEKALLPKVASFGFDGFESMLSVDAKDVSCNICVVDVKSTPPNYSWQDASHDLSKVEEQDSLFFHMMQDSDALSEMNLITSEFGSLPKAGFIFLHGAGQLPFFEPQAESQSENTLGQHCGHRNTHSLESQEFAANGTFGGFHPKVVDEIHSNDDPKKVEDCVVVTVNSARPSRDKSVSAHPDDFALVQSVQRSASSHLQSRPESASRKSFQIDERKSLPHESVENDASNEQQGCAIAKASTALEESRNISIDDNDKTIITDSASNYHADAESLQSSGVVISEPQVFVHKVRPEKSPKIDKSDKKVRLLLTTQVICDQESDHDNFIIDEEETPLNSSVTAPRQRINSYEYEGELHLFPQSCDGAITELQSAKLGLSPRISSSSASSGPRLNGKNPSNHENSKGRVLTVASRKSPNPRGGHSNFKSGNDPSGKTFESGYLRSKHLQERLRSSHAGDQDATGPSIPSASSLEKIPRPPSNSRRALAGGRNKSCARKLRLYNSGTQTRVRKRQLHRNRDSLKYGQDGAPSSLEAMQGWDGDSEQSLTQDEEESCSDAERESSIDDSEDSVGASEDHSSGASSESSESTDCTYSSQKEATDSSNDSDSSNAQSDSSPVKHSLTARPSHNSEESSHASSGANFLIPDMQQKHNISHTCMARHQCTQTENTENQASKGARDKSKQHNNLHAKIQVSFAPPKVSNKFYMYHVVSLSEPKSMGSMAINGHRSKQLACVVPASFVLVPNSAGRNRASSSKAGYETVHAWVACTKDLSYNVCVRKPFSE